MEEDETNFFAELGLIVLLIILAMMIIPILLGVGIAFIAGATGYLFWGIVITIAAFMWLIMGLIVAI